jgi:hypothetical protein
MAGRFGLLDRVVRVIRGSCSVVLFGELRLTGNRDALCFYAFERGTAQLEAPSTVLSRTPCARRELSLRLEASATFTFCFSTAGCRCR